jgi:transcriptional regulator with XRE-family HTH domain
MPVKRTRTDSWDGTRVRALRRHLQYTQQQLSDELGTRQQTVSEWETGMYRPRGASARLLTLIAERAGFGYQTNGELADSAAVAAPDARQEAPQEGVEQAGNPAAAADGRGRPRGRARRQARGSS